MVGVIAKAIACWMLLLVAAIMNATIRERFFTPWAGDLVGRAFSSLTLSVVIFAIVFVVVRWFPISSLSGFWLLGLFWTVLTVAFEFSFGILRGLSWETMLSDYNLLNGRLWSLVLLATLISPVLAARLRGLIK
jgi:hypothetical protein